MLADIYHIATIVFSLYQQLFTYSLFLNFDRRLRQQLKVRRDTSIMRPHCWFRCASFHACRWQRFLRDDVHKVRKSQLSPTFILFYLCFFGEVHPCHSLPILSLYWNSTLYTTAHMSSPLITIPLYRITSEIIADLPGIYEMPAEAVGWVERVRTIHFIRFLQCLLTSDMIIRLQSVSYFALKLCFCINE